MLAGARRQSLALLLQHFSGLFIQPVTVLFSPIATQQEVDERSHIINVHLAITVTVSAGTRRSFASKQAVNHRCHIVDGGFAIAISITSHNSGLIKFAQFALVGIGDIEVPY